MGLLPRSPSQYPSLLLYILDQTHITLTAITASTILITRSPHVAYFAIGALCSSLAAKSIKPLFVHPRPPPTSAKSQVRPKKTFGFPSTHSTALTFYLIYLLPPLLSGLTLNPSHSPSSTFSSPHGQSPYREFTTSPSRSPYSFHLFNHHLHSDSPSLYFLALIGISLYWFGGLWSRVKLGYHTLNQVLGGVGLGTILALGWRWGWGPGVERVLGRLIEFGWGITFGRILGG